MRLSIFTDELGIDITDGIAILRDWGMKWVDFRSRTFGKAAETLNNEELATLRKLVNDHGMKVACLESSLAKVHLPEKERYEAELQKLENLIRAADVLDCRMVRAFFFWQPRGTEPAGCLEQRPDMLQKVLDQAGPMCERARAAGLTFAFENCGTTVPECYAVLDALNMPEFGLAWDPANEWLAEGEVPDAKAIAVRAERSRVIHVKCQGIVPELPARRQVPWDDILLALANCGFTGPVSIETHNPDKAADRVAVSRQVLDQLREVWPGGAAAPVVQGKFDFDPVRFVVVGLGLGASRAKEMLKTPGVELAGVCDMDKERAERVGTDLGVEWTTDLQSWLDRKDVDAVFVVTPTGKHAAVAIPALRAGKHVITTKPMDASVGVCDQMIEAADKAGKLLAVDFAMRLSESTQRLRHHVAAGTLGQVLAGNMALKVQRKDDYFEARGGWRGTWELDGGGAMSNQNIHYLDEMIYVLGVPSRVSMRIWTQTHDIEVEDLGMATWEFANGAVIHLSATTSFPQPAWYNNLELHGTQGAVMRMSGGPYPAGIERWLIDGKWQNRAPKAPAAGYMSSAQNMADAIRTGAALLCDGRDGRRSRYVLDAMYESARNEGAWIDIGEEAMVGSDR